MLKYLLLFVGISIGIQANAQKKPTLRFDNPHHDFGSVKEEENVVHHTYKVFNDGDTDLLITKVAPSCGCTVAEYTKTGIAPKQSGYIKASFDVVNKHGKQDKSITIYSNGSPAVHLLSFSATISERPRKWTDTFLHSSGSLYYESSTVGFTTISADETDTVGYLRMYNSGANPVIIKEFRASVDWITPVEIPFTINPGERKLFGVHYNAQKANDFGLLYNEIKISTTDDKFPEKTIGVIAEIVPASKILTKEDALNAPKIFLPTLSHDFGVVKQGADATYSFNFSNTGKSDLKVLKIKTSCGCTAGEASKTTLKKGEAANIKVNFSSRGMQGIETKNVKIYTNDPARPEVTLIIKANVVSGDQVEPVKPKSTKTK
ncbi:MAG: DUF1573 domain-containing protein [Bacteroidota bacterium]|nr:DUF1573 domain-containing protein [Bacteroidota bacterium]